MVEDADAFVQRCREQVRTLHSDDEIEKWLARTTRRMLPINAGEAAFVSSRELREKRFLSRKVLQVVLLTVPWVVSIVMAPEWLSGILSIVVMVGLLVILWRLLYAWPEEED